MVKAMVTLFAAAAIVSTVVGPTLAAHTASGGGTYFVAPGFLSQFQFSPGFLQCKIAEVRKPTVFHCSIPSPKRLRYGFE